MIDIAPKKRSMSVYGFAPVQYIRLSTVDFGLLVKKDRMLLIALDAFLQQGVIDSRDLGILSRLKNIQTIKDFCSVKIYQWKSMRQVSDKKAHLYYDLGQELIKQLDLQSN